MGGDSFGNRFRKQHAAEQIYMTRAVHAAVQAVLLWLWCHGLCALSLFLRFFLLLLLFLLLFFFGVVFLLLSFSRVSRFIFSEIPVCSCCHSTAGFLACTALYCCECECVWYTSYCRIYMYTCRQKISMVVMEVVPVLLWAKL